MDFRGLLFIATILLFSVTMAEWNPNSPLFVVDLQTKWKTFTKVFPLEIPFSIMRLYSNSMKYYKFCPIPNATYEHCNYDLLNISMTDQSPQLCHKPINYNLLPDLDNLGRHIKCVNNRNRGSLYHFAYFLCRSRNELPKERKIIYKMCYRDDEKQMIFASATIVNPSLLREPTLQDQQTYPFELDVSHWFDEYTKDIVNASVFLYQEGALHVALVMLECIQVHQKYLYLKPSKLILEFVLDIFCMIRTPNYTPTCVLPPVLFPFAHQKIPFLHFMNMAPMESTLKETWNFSLNRLAEKLSMHKLPINVYAGLLGTVQDSQWNTVYLGEYKGKKEMPIPYMFWTMIASHTKLSGVAIIIHNIDYSRVETQPNQIDDDCSVQVCQNANLAYILPHSQFCNIVCCKPRVIDEYFQLGVNNELFKFADLPEEVLVP